MVARLTGTLFKEGTLPALSSARDECKMVENILRSVAFCGPAIGPISIPAPAGLKSISF